MKKFLHTKEKGFTLLFAVLVSTLVVSIGASIISIALRQTILSGTSRESQYAFYAANTVLECAYYWDVTNPLIFQTGEAGIAWVEPEDTVADDITCAGRQIMKDSSWVLDSSSETTFQIEVFDIDPSDASPEDASVRRCGMATVRKIIQADGKITTQIEAKGYNTDCNLDNPRMVERGLFQQYSS